MDNSKSRRGGPNSPSGKKNSSQNSTSHGMCQERFLLLPGESPEAYQALLQTWRQQYDLNEPAVPALVETLAERDWMQQRCTRHICRLEIKLAEAEAADDDAQIEKIERRLTNAYRYKTAAENSFQRALRALEKFRAVRKREEFTKARLDLRQEQIAYTIALTRIKLGVSTPEGDNDVHPPKQNL